jgi:hypothetical protein
MQFVKYQKQFSQDMLLRPDPHRPQEALRYLPYNFFGQKQFHCPDC